MISSFLRHVARRKLSRSGFHHAEQSEKTPDLFDFHLLERVQGAIMSKSKAYHAELIENLRDPREAEEYLNAALEEDDPELFLVALRSLFEFYGGKDP